MFIKSSFFVQRIARFFPTDRILEIVRLNRAFKFLGQHGNTAWNPWRSKLRNVYQALATILPGTIPQRRNSRGSRSWQRAIAAWQSESEANASKGYVYVCMYIWSNPKPALPASPLESLARVLEPPTQLSRGPSCVMLMTSTRRTSAPIPTLPG